MITVPLNDIYHPILPKDGTTGFRIRILRDTKSEKLTWNNVMPEIETANIKAVYPHDIVKTIRYEEDNYVLCSLNDQDLFEVSVDTFFSLFEPAKPLERYKAMTSDKLKIKKL